MNTHHMQNIDKIVWVVILFMLTSCGGGGGSSSPQVSVNFIASGGASNCRINSNNGVMKCWGQNDLGQLGIANIASTAATPTIVNFGSGQSVKQVVIGIDHACAILNDSTVSCWGDNSAGQLGQEPLLVTNSSSPMPVSSVTAKSIALGIEHTCIVTLTDSVQCWGSNSKGQLGQSANIIQSYLPQSPVLGLKAKSIKSGYNHLCAIDFDNSVYCWGDNQYGQLGNGTYLDSNAIVSAIGLTGVQQLGLGAYHSCAATTAGISCWGRNDTDQLGSNSGTLSLNVPTQTAASRANVKQLVAGLSHSCALSGNTAECWGGNSSKQLSGNSVGGIAFIGVVFNSNPSSLSAGLNHTCAQSIDNLTYCWGAGTLGRLGPNVNSDSDIPVLVP